MDKVTRPSLVGRLLAAAYPNGITADQVGLTWSCYAPAEDGEPCGTCNSCLQPK